MATVNPFDILGNDDNEDPSQLVAAVSIEKFKKVSAPAAAHAQPGKPAGKLPSKPLPPAQAVREARNDSGRGRGRGGARGLGQGRGGGRRYEQDSSNSERIVGGNDGFSGGYNRRFEEGESGRSFERRGGGGPRGPSRGGRRGGFGNEEVGEDERPRRMFDRHSGTGRGNGFKRDGAGRGNWGTPTDEAAPVSEEVAGDTDVKTVPFEKPVGEEEGADTSNVNAGKETEEEPEPEDKEMTLEEYEKVLEEKRKALDELKAEERKVEVDKELKSMQQLSSKKNNDDIFIKLGSEKDKRKDAYEKEEKAKKLVSINEFLKPADGERYYNPGGRGRGRGRGPRGGGSSGSSGRGYVSSSAAPKIEDHGQFPSLGGK
ncbi:hypothetical protein SAY86_012207 [Trapa natans]|uniref:Hyaluronan/mRNA-binding protein domain-containing protein n=1 Tax=Trapa natans TaxID=22666 RepID=A0AAN7MC83_TRANT|nr:hypothetical protein SAY86_012207 [Trapa natans]